MDDATHTHSPDGTDVPLPPNRRDESGRSDLSEIARLLSGDLPTTPGGPGGASGR